LSLAARLLVLPAGCVKIQLPRASATLSPSGPPARITSGKPARLLAALDTASGVNNVHYVLRAEHMRATTFIRRLPICRDVRRIKLLTNAWNGILSITPYTERIGSGI
jgi:hypothetical protein